MTTLNFSWKQQESRITYEPHNLILSFLLLPLAVDMYVARKHFTTLRVLGYRIGDMGKGMAISWVCKGYGGGSYPKSLTCVGGMCFNQQYFKSFSIKFIKLPLNGTRK